MEHVTTVLIADSADDFCTALTAALQHADGFQVVGTANDGEQAIRMVEERKPDVLVLDLMLSKKDGISVLKAVSGMERRPITLATSVFVTQYVSAAAANLGVRYLMLKPCDMTALVERLEEIRGGDGQKAAESAVRTRPASSPWSRASSTRSAFPPTSRATSICGRPSSSR